MQRLQSALPSLVVWHFDQEAAFRYGSIAAELRRTGRPNASCRHHGRRDSFESRRLHSGYDGKRSPRHTWTDRRAVVAVSIDERWLTTGKNYNGYGDLFPGIRFANSHWCLGTWA